MSLRRSLYDPACLASALVLGFVLLSSPGAVAAPLYDSGGSGEAANLLADAHRADYHGRITEAIGDDTKALALMPSYGEAYLDRVYHYMDAGRYKEATDDLDRVLAMHPDAMWVAIKRAELDLRRGDGNAALADVKNALKLPLFSAWHNPQEASTYEPGSGTQYAITGHMESHALAYSSIAELLLHQDDAALADMDRMMKIETEHPEYVLASYCYVGALAGVLEMAELACQEAIARNPHDIGQYDSLGFVHLRMKKWDQAIADYNMALTKRPDLTYSLYGRGIAKRARGDIAGGNADLAAATSAEPDIANIMKRLGAPDA